MEGRSTGSSLAQQAERLASRIDSLAIHRSKREQAKADLLAAFALVDFVIAANELLRRKFSRAVAPRSGASLADVEHEVQP